MESERISISRLSSRNSKMSISRSNSSFSGSSSTSNASNFSEQKVSVKKRKRRVNRDHVPSEPFEGRKRQRRESSNEQDQAWAKYGYKYNDSNYTVDSEESEERVKEEAKEETQIKNSQQLDHLEGLDFKKLSENHITPIESQSSS